MRARIERLRSLSGDADKLKEAVAQISADVHEQLRQSRLALKSAARTAARAECRCVELSAIERRTADHESVERRRAKS